LSSDEGHPSAETPPGQTPRRASTIDLTASEVERERHSEPQASEAANPGEGAAPEAAAPAPVRRPILPFVGAGLTGGLVGALVYALASMLIAPPDSGSALASRVSALEQQLREVLARAQAAGPDAKRIDELASRIATLESAIASRQGASDNSGLVNRISTLEGNLKALAESVGIAQRRTDEALTFAREGSERANAAAAALDALTQRISKMEQELAKRTAAQNVDRQARLLSASTALTSAIERGDAFASELSAMRALGAASAHLTALEPFAATGVPSALALSRELSALMPTLLAASGTAPAEGSFLQKLQANAERLVRIHRVEETPGNDVAAVLTRIAAAAEHRDIPPALAELGKLPPEVRAPAEAWIKKAQAREAALAAARAMSAEALAGLSR
jgi:hypothetical protein